MVYDDVLNDYLLSNSKTIAVFSLKTRFSSVSVVVGNGVSGGVNINLFALAQPLGGVGAGNQIDFVKRAETVLLQASAILEEAGLRVTSLVVVRRGASNVLNGNFWDLDLGVLIDLDFGKGTYAEGSVSDIVARLKTICTG